MATTGERIKAARLAAKMTQEELANKIGVKYAAIHKYEKGLVVNLKRDTIEKLSDALNVKPSYLMCIDDEEKTATPQVDETKNKIMELYNLLSEEDRAVVENYIDFLIQQKKK